MATIDTTAEIRRRRRELEELGFGAEETAAQLGPEAQEQEFTDRFKRQYEARQAEQDAERGAADTAVAAERSDRAGRDAVIADRKGLMQDIVPPGQLAVPGLDGFQETQSADGDLVVPGLPSAGSSARPAARGAWPGVPVADRRPAAAAAARATPPVAQLARDRQRQKDQARAPGGLNVSPQQLEADRAAASQSARAPAPAKSGSQDLRERSDRARDSKEIEQYRIASDRYNAQWQAWKTQYDDAAEMGDQVRLERLAASEPQAPDPPLSVTGGLEPNEVKAVRDHDNDPSTPRVAETAAQTLDRLRESDPAAYDALRATAQRAVGSDPERLGEWISTQFGEMEPDARLTAMSTAGTRLADSRPQLAVPSGTRGALGTPGRRGPDSVPYDRAAIDPTTGKPMIIRDPFNRGRVETIPSGAGGDLPTPAGNLIRAPQQQEALKALGVDSLEAFPVAPAAMTPEWRQQMLGIGMMAFGLRREDFAEGADGDNLFIAATQNMLRQHQDKMARGYETVPVVTGGYRYQPGQEMRDRQKVRTQQSEATRVKKARASGANAIDPDTGATLGELLDAAAAEGDQQRVRELTAKIRAADQSARTQGVADARSMEADEKNRNNPARAPGMFRRSLAQAGNDPQAIAAVYRDWGMPREAERILAMENQRFSIEQQGAVARAEAEANRPKPDFEVANQARQSVVGAMTDPDGATMTHDAAVMTVAQADGIYVPGPEGKPITGQQRQQAELSLGRLLIQSGVPLTHPSIQVAVRQVWGRTRNDGVVRSEEADGLGGLVESERKAFRRNLRDQLGITDQALADRLYDQYRATGA